MSENSKIEWTDATWNPVRGCTKVSTGCKYCYAETFAERFRGVPSHPFENGFDLRLVPDKLTEPFRWKKPKVIFVNSMSDLFHEDIPLSYIQKVFKVMNEASHHTFQILTKRSKRLLKVSSRLSWPINVWMGVSIENSEYTFRVSDLISVPAAVRFLSIEPLIDSIPNLLLDRIDWVIVGGESGFRARPMNLNWAREIRDQCIEAHVPFFLKQLGGRRGKRGGPDAVLDGRQWHEYPNSGMYPD